MKHNIYPIIGIALMACASASCSDTPEAPDGKLKMEFDFSLSGSARATETAFETGDAVGVFVSDTSRPLEIGGNVVNNEKITFDGAAWRATRNLYWDAGTYNFVAYYPFITDISSITDMPFEVSTDQRDLGGDGMDGYEQSDFLYARSRNVAASTSPVAMQFSHKMSKLTVRLIKGEDYEGEIPETALVEIHNTYTKATIDLEAGVVTKDSHSERKTIKARQASPTSYTAILVPQRLENRVPLVEVNMNGVSFLVESKFIFKPGVHHTLNLIIDDNPEKIKIEIGGEIVGWN